MTTMTMQPGTDPQVPVALPTRSLLLAVILGSIGAAVAFVVTAWSLGAEPWARAGVFGGAVVMACTTLGLLAISPWTPRPVPMWVSMWLGQTVVRLLVTPVVAYLVYSAASVPLMAFASAVGACYLAAVLIEAKVLTRFLMTRAATLTPTDDASSGSSDS